MPLELLVAIPSYIRHAQKRQNGAVRSRFSTTRQFPTRLSARSSSQPNPLQPCDAIWRKLNFCCCIVRAFQTSLCLAVLRSAVLCIVFGGLEKNNKEGVASKRVQRSVLRSTQWHLSAVVFQQTLVLVQNESWNKTCCVPKTHGYPNPNSPWSGPEV